MSEPVPYDTLVRVQLATNRLAVAVGELDRLTERLDGWVNKQLGLVDNGRLKADDYSAAVSEEFLRCVDARERLLDDAARRWS